jgi:hypothetical protein
MRRERRGRRGTRTAVPFRAPRYSRAVVVDALEALRFRGDHFHAMAAGSVVLCIALWVRAKTVDQDERANAERRAIFVGLWAPTLWQVGDALDARGRRRLFG